MFKNVSLKSKCIPRYLKQSIFSNSKHPKLSFKYLQLKEFTRSE